MYHMFIYVLDGSNITFHFFKFTSFGLNASAQCHFAPQHRKLR